MGVGGAVFALERIAILLEGMGENAKAAAHRGMAEEIEEGIEYGSDDEAGFLNNARTAARFAVLDGDGIAVGEGGDGVGGQVGKGRSVSSKACVVS
jgi:hypothetical protein